MKYPDSPLPTKLCVEKNGVHCKQVDFSQLITGTRQVNKLANYILFRTYNGYMPSKQTGKLYLLLFYVPLLSNFQGIFFQYSMGEISRNFTAPVLCFSNACYSAMNICYFLKCFGTQGPMFTYLPQHLVAFSQCILETAVGWFSLESHNRQSTV